MPRFALHRLLCLALLLVPIACDDHGEDEEHPAAAQAPAGRSYDPLAAHVVSSRHGGLVTTTGDFRVETVFRRDSIAVHVSDRAGRPVDASSARGRVAIEFRDRREPLSAELQPREGSLEAAIDLSGVEEGEAKALVRVEGLPGAGGNILAYPRIVRWAR